MGLSSKNKYNAAKLEEHQRDHSLYIAFAPAEDPQIAVAVIVENAGFGSAHAAPIARRVFDYWLMGQYPNAADMAAVKIGKVGAPAGKPLLAAEVPWPPLPLGTTATAPVTTTTPEQLKKPAEASRAVR